MRVLNEHHRDLPASPEAVGAVLETLAGPSDRLWPRHQWPAMVLDGPLAVGSAGGHGPIRYRVEGHEPGRSVTFRFTAPAGFEGTHGLTVERTVTGTRLTHRIEMTTSLAAAVQWALVFRPLHDALVEDALDVAAQNVGARPEARPWSLRVRLLRRFLTLVRRRHGQRAAS